MPAGASQSTEDVRQRANRQMALLWGAAALGLLVLSPLGGHIAAGLWACPFKTLTGVPCPTCGVTRSALALSHFDIAGALIAYPLQTLGWIVFIGGGLAAAGWALLGRRFPSPPGPLPLWAKAGIGTTIASNWLYCIATGV